LGHIGTDAAAEAIATIWLGEQADVWETAQYTLVECGIAAIPVVCQELTRSNVNSRPRVSALTPSTLAFWITTEVALHALPGRHERNHKSALIILHTLIDRHGLVVFERILATPKLPPQDKFGCLEILRRRRRMLALVLYFRDTRSYCEHTAATSDDPEVRIGAREVLDYCSLARGSLQPLSVSSDQLLRAAESEGIETPEEELLRGSDYEQPPLTEEEQEPSGLIAKALRRFRRN
jgi:hypothetical protein